MPYYPPDVVRQVNTLRPLSGGGSLSVDRTLSADTLALVQSSRTISTVFPLSGGGDLSGNRTLSVDTNLTIAKDLLYWRHAYSNTMGASFDRLYVANWAGVSALSDAVFAIDTAYCIPIIIANSTHISGVVTRVISTAAGALLRIGLYTNSGGNTIYPFQAIQTSEIIKQQGLASGGFTEVLTANQLYWLVVHTGTATSNLRTVQATGQNSYLFSADSGLGTTAASPMIRIALVFSNGLPSSFATGGFLTNAIPIAAMAIRISA